MWKYEKGRGWFEPDPLNDPLHDLPTMAIPAAVAPLLGATAPPGATPLAPPAPPPGASPAAPPGGSLLPPDDLAAVADGLAALGADVLRTHAQWTARLAGLTARLDKLHAAARRTDG